MAIANSPVDKQTFSEAPPEFLHVLSVYNTESTMNHNISKQKIYAFYNIGNKMAST